MATFGAASTMISSLNHCRVVTKVDNCQLSEQRAQYHARLNTVESWRKSTKLIYQFLMLVSPVLALLYQYFSQLLLLRNMYLSPRSLRCVLNSYIFYLCHIPFCLFTALLRCKDTNYFQFCIKIASLFTFFLQFLCQTSLFPPLKTQKRSTEGAARAMAKV